tara:strand:+ start:396 stop:890 length:495 start_codon:yes stop_codon:yes gene_type:complete
MKITKSQLKQIISEELEGAIQEAHGLSKKDAKTLKDFAKDQRGDIKRILDFLIKSNVEVDRTQDVTKMKKDEGEELEERCQKGYKTHPTRKTKKMFGRTYRNCVKAEGMDDEVAERKLKPGEKRKLKSLEKKVPKDDFTDRYGKEGESIYYATLTKMAKKGKKK